MTLAEVRAKYLEFFKTRGHTYIPSASLVPENDPSTLFVSSGMQPLVPYLLGQPHPGGKRLVNIQKSLRTGDIEETGDNRHLTFFEMFGNWSLGDYFKQEQLPWVFELLTQELGLDPQRIYITVYDGDANIGVPRDEESIKIWKGLYAQKGIDAQFVSIGSEAKGYETGMQGGRIFGYTDKNWWSRAGTPEKMPAGEPGGPDSEVFYEFPHVEHDTKFGELCHVNCDCGHFIELGNSVFMEYVKHEDGSFQKLKQQNVDFGGGFERLVAATLDSDDAFMSGGLQAIIQKLEEWSGKQYQDKKYQKTFRIVSDHMRAATFLIGDGAHPSGVERGYIVRRLLRRAVRFADSLGIGEGKLPEIVAVVTAEHESGYPELRERQDAVQKEIAEEEGRFRKTLERGLKEFGRFAGDNAISAQDAFQLVTTFGFPLELILEEAGERGIKQIDIEGFKELLKGHQDLSRAGSEQKFKGGLADTSEKTVRLHTAHHLLLKALQQVLGPEVHQRGSNITGERLRIDFNYGAKMTPEQKAEVEKIVNEKIREDLPVIRNEMDKEEAEKLGAEHEFGAKYPDRVSVYSVGPLESAFSLEFCGGPHVEHTAELSKSGVFKISKEEAVAQGIRRIKAVLE